MPAILLCEGKRKLKDNLAAFQAPLKLGKIHLISPTERERERLCVFLRALSNPNAAAKMKG